MRGPDRTIRITQKQLVEMSDHFLRHLSEEQALQWTIGEDTYERVQVYTVMNSGGDMVIEVWDTQEEET